MCSGGDVLAVAGTLYVTPVRLPAPASVTSVCGFIFTAGGTLTTSQCYAGLWAAAGGAPIGMTADQHTAWQSTGYKPMALTSGPFACAAGDYFVGWWANGSTLPSFARHAGGSAMLNLGLSGSSCICAAANTGLTTNTTPSLGALTANSHGYWAAVS
jgi:hypothetical protein